MPYLVPPKGPFFDHWGKKCYAHRVRVPLIERKYIYVKFWTVRGNLYSIWGRSCKINLGETFIKLLLDCLLGHAKLPYYHAILLNYVGDTYWWCVTASGGMWHLLLVVCDISWWYVTEVGGMWHLLVWHLLVGMWHFLVAMWRLLVETVTLFGVP